MRHARREAGFTLVELATSVALMLFISAGAMLLIITSAKLGRRAQERSDMQRGGRTALDVVAHELAVAGLGLPSALAIARFSAAPTLADGCTGTPELVFASVDFQREWQVTGLSSGQLTIVATPLPAGVSDAPLAAGQWVYFYASPVLDSSALGNSGNALLQVGSTRSVGSSAVVIGSSAYSSRQTAFNFSQSFATRMMLLPARVSTFGVRCPAGGEPYVYWDSNGARVPVATGVDTTPLAADDASIAAKAGDVVALRFRFLLDKDYDGAPDDSNGDGVVDRADLVAVPTSLDAVKAVEVLVRVHSSEVDPVDHKPRVEDYSELVALPNLHTEQSAPSGGAQFVFVDNQALCTSNVCTP